MKATTLIIFLRCVVHNTDKFVNNAEITHELKSEQISALLSATR
jgi:hypothetical protein